MPAPRKGEKKSDFLKRYMSSSEAKRSFPKREQRYAVANSEWKRKKGKK